MHPTRVAVIGSGYWGPNLVRNLGPSESFDVAAICDCEQSRAAKVSAGLADVQTSGDRLLERHILEAGAVAAPAPSRRSITLRALEAVNHALVAAHRPTACPRRPRGPLPVTEPISDNTLITPRRETSLFVMGPRCRTDRCGGTESRWPKANGHTGAGRPRVQLIPPGDGGVCISPQYRRRSPEGSRSSVTRLAHGSSPQACFAPSGW